MTTEQAITTLQGSISNKQAEVDTKLFEIKAEKVALDILQNSLNAPLLNKTVKNTK